MIENENTEHSLNNSPIENYEITNKNGKFGEKYTAICISTNQPCLIEIRRLPKRTFERETKILQSLRGAPNIIQLLETIVDPQTKVASLVFENLNFTDLKSLSPSLSTSEIRFYLHKLLIAIEYVHSVGIMHRALKPRSVLIDPTEKRLQLADWEYAEFFIPNSEYNTRFRTRYSIPPEILLNIRKYDFSVDMWNFGCILAGILFKKEPFFTGYDNIDQLCKISKVLGTQELFVFIKNHNIQYQHISALGNLKKRDWKEYINPQNSERVSKEAIDFLDKLLKYEPSERLTAKEALHHPYLLKT